jgi:hypothetical protein
MRGGAYIGDDTHLADRASQEYFAAMCRLEPPDEYHVLSLHGEVKSKLHETCHPTLLAGGTDRRGRAW